jgi:CheY-like chemotaxis protein
VTVKGLRVLVVDDLGLMRGLLCEAVRASDVPIDDVVDARDGIEALEILEARQVDVVITDLHMPGLDGFELVARIARRPDFAHFARRR